MPLTVCTSSTEGQLASLGDLMVILGATASSSGIDRALTTATKWAETYVGYPLGRAVYQETLPAYGTRKLMLSRTPVRGVARLFDSTDTGGTAKELTSTEYQLQDQEAGFIERDVGFAWTAQRATNLTSYIVAGSETRPWLVTYEAGYTFLETSSTEDKWETTSTGRTLPEDIEEAILIRAADIYNGQDAALGGRIKVGPLELDNTRSESAGGASNQSAEGLLQPYRRVKF